MQLAQQINYNKMNRFPSIARCHTSYKTDFCDTKVPFKITSRSWVVMHSGKYLMGKHPKERKEIASLTKIMTAYTIITYCEEHGIDLKREYIRVSHCAANINGTSAELLEGDTLTVWDALHGMMLPSGNDAAIALSEHFGKIFFAEKYGTKRKSPRVPGRFFVGEMNKNARALHLFSTHYNNSHGLDNEYHKSCAYDVALLASNAMKNIRFAQLVSNQKYECEIIDAAGRKRPTTWENTNNLLGVDGYNGVKTGITPTAGPCLCASYDKGGVQLMVVIMNCKSVEKRYMEIKKLVRYSIKVLGRRSVQLPALTC